MNRALMGWVGVALMALVSAGVTAADGDKRSGTPPQVISRELPEYPYSLRLNGNRGEVVLEFIVDSKGEVRNPTIAKSTHPEFEAPAVEALLKWKFKPGMMEGRPVNTRMWLPITFELRGGFRDGVGEGGVDAFMVPAKASKELPDEFRYDKPPRPKLTSAPVYPRELLEQRVEGSATVVFLIDPTGRPRKVTVSKATHPEFGAAAAAMMRAWEFEPAQKDGKPSWAMLSRKQPFAPSERDSRVNDSAKRLLRLLKKTPEAVLTLKDIDAPPKPRYQPEPMISEGLLKSGGDAEAIVEFIIDRAGRAQLPRVVSTTNDEFGWAAATAVARWQFTPPTKDGKPVDVRARQPLRFSAKSRAENAHD